MPKPLFVASADLHAEYNSYVGFPGLWGDSYFALKQIVDRSLSLGAELILAGDVFDKNYPDSYTLREVFYRLDEMHRAERPVYFVQGQHELARRAPWLGLHKGTTHLHGSVFVPGRVCVLTGLDWLPAAELASSMGALKQLLPDRPTVLVCHQVWREFMGTHLASEGSLDELVPDFVDMVITGDFHGHQAVQRRNKNGHPYVVLSPGSTTLQAVGEDPQKYFFVVNDDLSYSSVPLEGRPTFYSQAYTDEQAADEVAKVEALLVAFKGSPLYGRLPENLRQPMWVVQVGDNASGAPALFKKAARDRLHLFLRPLGSRPDEEPVASLVERPLDGLREGLAAVAEPDTPVYSTCLRLIGAADYKDEVSRLVEEAFDEGAQRLGRDGAGDGVRRVGPDGGGFVPVEEPLYADAGQDFGHDVVAEE